jgi:hypothetical protein
VNEDKRKKLLALAEHPATPVHEADAARRALEALPSDVDEGAEGPVPTDIALPSDPGADVHVGDLVYITGPEDFFGLVVTVVQVGSKGHTTGSDAAGWIHHQWPYYPNRHIVTDSKNRLRQYHSHEMLKLVPIRERTADETDPDGVERKFAADCIGYENRRAEAIREEKRSRRR